MIVDASVIIDAVSDPGPRGSAARAALGEQPSVDVLHAPGHLAIEVLSGLVAAAHRPAHPLQPHQVERVLADAAALGVRIDPTPWADVVRARVLSTMSLRYSDAVYVAAAERERTALLTADGRIGRSGAPVRCEVVTVLPAQG